MLFMSRHTIFVVGFFVLIGCTVAKSQTTKPAATQPSPANWVESNPKSPVIEGAKLKRLGSGYFFTEGPTSDDKGNVFFVDQPSNRILEWSISGEISTWLKPSGHANGMSFDSNGDLIACADELSQLWAITPEKKVTVLLKNYQGKFLNGPNDVWIRRDGGMYLTDPFYLRDWWKVRGQKMEQDVQGVYYLTPDRKTLKRVISDFQQPNGIIGTPDGKTLYVSDIKAGQTFSYTIKSDDSLADKKLFCKFGSDGMTIDSDGNVYTSANGGLQIIDKQGKLIETIPVHAANSCFGGQYGHLLFITARTEVYGLQMRTHRVGPQ
jgi:gluconolactonase